MKAFPQLDSQCYDQFRDKGMDLRDYFASQAMGSLTIAYALLNTCLDLEEICDGAYQYADRMMEARK